MTKYRILLAGFGILLMTIAADAQFPGGGGPGGAGGMRGTRGMGGGWDPNAIFDKMSGGKDVVVRDSLTDDWQRSTFDRVAQRMNITNGQLTREQFAESSRQAMERMKGGGPPMGPG